MIPGPAPGKLWLLPQCDKHCLLPLQASYFVLTELMWVLAGFTLRRECNGASKALCLSLVQPPRPGGTTVDTHFFLHHCVHGVHCWMVCVSLYDPHLAWAALWRNPQTLHPHWHFVDRFEYYKIRNTSDGHISNSNISIILQCKYSLPVSIKSTPIWHMCSPTNS